MSEPPPSEPKQRVSVFSFDVFDTCVTRMHAHPRDLFLDLGYRIAPEQYSNWHKARFARSFQRRRIWAEKIAYLRARPHKSATLNDIYRNFIRPFGLRISNDELISKEIALEKESSYPIPEIFSEIRRNVDEGQRVIFVSDMYLSASDLIGILARHGLSDLERRIYVSSDVKATKHSGNLFQHVLLTENISGQHVTHVGDNHWADINMASQFGISSHHFEKAKLTKHEIGIAGKNRSNRIDRSYLAALSRKFRLTIPPDVGSGSAELGHLVFGTIAPFLVAYVNWLLKDAIENGIRRLYFVARDGEVLFKIARKLLRDNPRLEIRYLHGSRRAWLLPSITRDSTAWVHLLATPGQSNSRQDVLSRAGLGTELADSVRKLLAINNAEWTESLSCDEAKSFIANLFNDNNASSLIFEHADKARAVALQFLAQEGLLDDQPWALVDIGWSLNCQAALKRILGTVKGSNVSPLGYYLGLTRDHLPTQEAGSTRCFIPDHGSIFSRRRVIVEHCFTPSTHATTRSYCLRSDGLVSPVFGEEMRSASELRYATCLHEIAEHAAETVALDGQSRRVIECYTDAIITNAARLIRFPSRQEAELISHFGTVADLRHEQRFLQPLCRTLGLEDVKTVIMVALARKQYSSTPAFMWLEGSKALSPVYVRLPLSLILRADATLHWLRERWTTKTPS